MEGMQLLDTKPTRATGPLVIHDNFANRIALVLAMGHSNFCPINFRR